MGFYFRKSVSFGPVRFNFSKSGVGVSVGVKGARISTGPRGTYVHAGRNGFYYRQRIDTPGPRSQSQVHWQPNVQPSTSGSHVIQTADVSHLVETSSADILQQINSRSQQIRYAPFALIATLAATILVFLLINFCANTLTDRFVHDHELANTIVTIADFVFSGITLVVGLIFSEKTRKGDMLRLTTPLFYELEQDVLDRFSTIQKACETLARSIRIWRVETDTPTFDWKRNAGASSLVTRKLINVERLQPPYIATNVDVWSIKLNNQTLFFFPDHVLVRQSERYGAVSYESLNISFAPTRFIEDNGVPNDAKIVDHTWKYVNKKGGPDRRFSNNRQLPIAQYGFIELRSHTGLNIHFHVSNIQAAEYFAQAFNHILGAKEKQQQWQQPPRDEEPKQSRSKKSEAETPKKSAYEILGVPVGASSEEIVAAYHQMAKMYHPDRLAHLAPEFVALAEERMKEINAAYEELK